MTRHYDNKVYSGPRKIGQYVKVENILFKTREKR